MSSLNRKLFLFAAAAFAAGTALPATPAPAVAQDLNAKLEVLQAEIAEIKAQQAAQVRHQTESRTTDQLLNDANRHSQLLDAQGVR